MEKDKEVTISLKKFETIIKMNRIIFMFIGIIIPIFAFFIVIYAGEFGLIETPFNSNYMTVKIPNGGIYDSKLSTLIPSEHIGYDVNTFVRIYNEGEQDWNLVIRKNLTVGCGIGDSMLPTIRNGGCTLNDKNFKLSDIKPGDIIQFDSSKTKISVQHRVVFINGTHFITKGDNPYTNPINDDIETVDKITGLVVGILY